MKQCLFVVFAFFVAPVCSSSVSAKSSATFWLKSHGTPTDDQLSELKNANPDAYAMVKALLNKHSMGLVTLAPEEKGPDVFRKMMGNSANRASDVALLAQPSDQYQYNPQVAADKDESMVSSLLAAVAGLAGKKGKKIALLNRRHHKAEDVNPLLEDADAFTPEAPKVSVEQAAAMMQEEAAPVAPVTVAAPKKTNSYLQGLDLDVDAPFATPALVSQPVSHHEDDEGSLGAFSFGDTAAAELEPEKPKEVIAPPPKKDNSFLKWLGMVKKAPAPVAQGAQEAAAEDAAVPEMAKGNPYLAELDSA